MAVIFKKFQLFHDRVSIPSLAILKYEIKEGVNRYRQTSKQYNLPRNIAKQLYEVFLSFEYTEPSEEPYKKNVKQSRE